MLIYLKIKFYDPRDYGNNNYWPEYDASSFYDIVVTNLINVNKIK